MRKVIRWIKDSERIFIISHADPDGICSAALIYKLIRSLGKKIERFVPSSPEKIANRLKRLRKGGLFFILDLPPSRALDEIKSLSKQSRVIVIDHHSFESKLGSKKIIYLHPQPLGIKRYCPTSKLIFNLFFPFLKEEDWIACVGAICDAAGREWKGFIGRALARYGLGLGEDENLMDTLFGEIGFLIYIAHVIEKDKGAAQAFQLLIQSDGPKDFIERSKFLARSARKIRNFVDRLLKEFELSKELYQELELAFFELREPKYAIGSLLAQELSFKNPNLTLVILSKKKKFTSVNLRRGDGKINVALLAQHASKGIGSGGGHPQSAGAFIPTSKLELFKDKILEMLRLAT
jgi:single-stranded DNA-specific DHH superfamily exonuclease